ncbi:class I SAM-dependent methyltransferase [Winogradskyella aurantiaca]|uniref:class I SAM-dependent methyltransferase n=1 Tax=Winogradskyella aurantiaca TaxID=2219558 RepID=UPI000E1E174E|nr:class I SAM-dependent methyltransferase [Winogradskyella aurantiaca]
MKFIQTVILYCMTLMFCVVQAQDSGQYIFKKGDYSGIGKWYMGREIAHVMGYQGMTWLERPEREQEERTSLLLENMALEPTDIVADIGAGSGYHVIKMAPLVNNGRVYAVDIQPEMLEAIKTNPKARPYSNINLVLGSTETVNLPENSVDKVLMVDVYHEFSYPYEMLLSIKKALKPNGKIYLIEYRGEDSSVPIKPLHKMTEAQAKKEFESAGFSLEVNMDNLPWQHCMVFVKDEN